MLIGMDEYPYHQITSTFAGVAGTEPAWSDGHYICLSDMVGEISEAQEWTANPGRTAAGGSHE